MFNLWEQLPHQSYRQGCDLEKDIKPSELQNVIFFTQIISVQLNLPQEKARKSRQVFSI